MKLITGRHHAMHLSKIYLSCAKEGMFVWTRGPVDKVVGRGPAAGSFDTDNFELMCHTCHSAVRPGGREQAVGVEPISLLIALNNHSLPLTACPSGAVINLGNKRRVKLLLL